MNDDDLRRRAIVCVIVAMMMVLEVRRRAPHWRGRRHARRGLLPKGKRWWVRLHEKGGKRHEMPTHHTLEAYLDSYLEAAGIRDAGKTPLFRSAAGRTGVLDGEAMHRIDAYRMIQRRAAEFGLKVKIGCHLFGRRYDRTGDEITLDEVERITI